MQRGIERKTNGERKLPMFDLYQKLNGQRQGKLFSISDRTLVDVLKCLRSVIIGFLQQLALSNQLGGFRENKLPCVFTVISSREIQINAKPPHGVPCISVQLHDVINKSKCNKQQDKTPAHHPPLINYHERSELSRPLKPLRANTHQ